MNRTSMIGILLCLIGGSVYPMKRLDGPSKESSGRAKRIKAAPKGAQQDRTGLQGGQITSKESNRAERLVTQIKARELSPIISLLSKVDVNNEDGLGATGLHYACLNNDFAVVLLLRARGLSVDARAFDGNTPLHEAAQNGHKDLCKFLLAQGAAANARSTQGYTPLHIAAQFGQKEVCELLIAQGAAVDARTDREKNWNRSFCEFTSLHSAVYANKLDVVKLLIKEGADTTARTKDGRTVVDIARQCGHQEILGYLEKRDQNIQSYSEMPEEVFSDKFHCVFEQSNNARVSKARAYTADELHTLEAMLLL